MEDSHYVYISIAYVFTNVYISNYKCFEFVILDSC